MILVLKDSYIFGIFSLNFDLILLRKQIRNQQKILNLISFYEIF